MIDKILLFDIDGTLLLTGGVGKIAFEKAFEELFRIPSAWGNTLPDGKTDPNIIDEIAHRVLKRYLAQAEYAALVKRYLAHFRSEIWNAPDFRLMPGVLELLNLLSKKENILLGIATGNLEEAAWLKLERGGIRRFFSCGGFGSDSNDRSELIQTAMNRVEKVIGRRPSSEEIYVIGDTHYDIRAAKKLGLKAIGVKTGTTQTEHFLGEDKPAHLLTDLSDANLFLNLIGLPRCPNSVSIHSSNS